MSSTDRTPPRLMRLSCIALGVWVVPALVWHLYAVTIVRYRTGAAAEIPEPFASDPAPLVLYFGSILIAVWVVVAVAVWALAAVRRLHVPRMLGAAIALAMLVELLAWIPARAWDGAMLRTIGPGEFGGDVLQTAMERDDTARVVWLTKHGVSIDALDHSGIAEETALMVASRWGNIRWMTFLLAHGADPNAGNSNNETPLMRAVAETDLPAVELLLAHGARVDGAMKVAEYEADSSVLRALKASQAKEPRP